MRALMVVGTTSHAGKSLLATAICRILARQGWRVTPFKGQNMALNSYVTANGGEMGYAQAVQAWAANVSPKVDMNPILLKPQGNMTSQVIVQGRSIGTIRADEYYEKFFQRGWDAITASLDRLGQDFEVVVCEGAGSPAEINLRHRDLTNMRVAMHLQAATVLVVDIDRGGAFAHVVGTLALLEPEERALIKGVVINKFRGIQAILDPGIRWLEQETQIPVLGVIPWMDQVFPSEDSLDLLDRRRSPKDADLTIAVVRLPHIANFTDFDPLESEPTVRVRYLELGDSLGYPDALVIPGSKTTIADLLALKKTGLAQEIKNYAQAGGTVMGICGGFQILGEKIIDPDGIEGHEGQFGGLGLLPIRTVFGDRKISRQRQVTSHYPQEGLPVQGYELHQGQSQVVPGNPHYVPLFNDPMLGLVSKTQELWGTYLHGVFDNGPWRRAWLNRLRQQRGLKALPTGISNYRTERETILDGIADVVQEHLDLTALINHCQG